MIHTGSAAVVPIQSGVKGEASPGMIRKLREILREVTGTQYRFVQNRRTALGNVCSTAWPVPCACHAPRRVLRGRRSPAAGVECGLR
jgi:hypothetical protein